MVSVRKCNFVVDGTFLPATAALEVQMLVSVSVTLATTVLDLQRTCKGLLKDLQRTSEGLWTLWSTKFTSLQVAAPGLQDLFYFV